MRLGILCTMINGFGRKGFYNSQEVGLGRSLARMGHDVVIYKCLNARSGVQDEWVEVEQGLRVHYIPARGLGAHGWISTRLLDTDLQGLLCFNDNQIFLPHIMRFCRAHGICYVPYVGTAHSLHSGLHAWIMDQAFALGTLKFLQKHPVIAKTEAARQELAGLGVHDVTVAPVGLDTAVLKADFAAQDRDALRRELGFGPEDRVLCNVSRMEPEKRPLELLDMLARLRARGDRSYKLVLVGEGPLRETVEQAVEANGMQRHVKLLKRVPYEDMWKIYAAADYFVNMNKGEIFGMAVMESVFYQTSVAAHMAPGPSVTLRDMPGHRLCADDAEIEAWLAGPYPSGEELACSAAKMAHDFSWDRCAEAMCRIIKASK